MQINIRFLVVPNLITPPPPLKSYIKKQFKEVDLSAMMLISWSYTLETFTPVGNYQEPMIYIITFIN